MVLGGVSNLGKTSLHFIEEGVKMNRYYHINEVLAKMLPETHALSDGDFIFQQDGAKCHTAHAKIAYIREHTPDFIKSSDWPPNSCHLNVCDYSIWNEVGTKLHRGKHYENIGEMKSALSHVWEELPQKHIDNAIDKFCEICHQVVEEEGGHIGHLR